MGSIPFLVIGQVIYWASLLAGFVAAAWIAFRRHRYARTVLGYGVAFAAPVLIAEALFLWLCMREWEAGGPVDLQTSIERDKVLLLSVIAVPLKFIGTVLFVVSGMYIAVRSGKSSLPVLRASTRASSPAEGLVARLHLGSRLLDAALVALFCYSYTVFIFTLGRPKESDDFAKLVRVMGGTSAVALLLLQGVISAPIFEEVVFRHFLQRAFGRMLRARPGGQAIGIALASLIWSMGHAGTVTPEWVKLAQTFPIGLVLGWLYERRGLETSVLAHFLFNGVSAILMSHPS